MAGVAANAPFSATVHQPGRRHRHIPPTASGVAILVVRMVTQQRLVSARCVSGARYGIRRSRAAPSAPSIGAHHRHIDVPYQHLQRLWPEYITDASVPRASPAAFGIENRPLVVSSTSEGLGTSTRGVGVS